MSKAGKCVNCGAVLDTFGKKRVVCPYCGTNNMIEKSEPKPGMIVCAQCGHENPQAHEHCSQCGANLYYVCPECSTRNTAEAVYCTKCGVNIAQAIMNWQIHEAQERERREELRKKQKKTARRVMIPVSIILTLLFIGLLITIEINTYNENKWHAQLTSTSAVRSLTATAEALAHPTETPQSYIDTFPFRWQSPDGTVKIYLKLEPNYGYDYMLPFILIFNESDYDCDTSLYEIYAEDDQGNLYEAESVWKMEKMDFLVPAGESKVFMSAVAPGLDKNVKEITFSLTEYCGFYDVNIPVDMTQVKSAE